MNFDKRGGGKREKEKRGTGKLMERWRERGGESRLLLLMEDGERARERKEERTKTDKQMIDRLFTKRNH